MVSGLRACQPAPSSGPEPPTYLCSNRNLLSSKSRACSAIRASHIPVGPVCVTPTHHSNCRNTSEYMLAQRTDSSPRTCVPHPPVLRFSGGCRGRRRCRRRWPWAAAAPCCRSPPSLPLPLRRSCPAAERIGLPVTRPKGTASRGWVMSVEGGREYSS